MRLLTLVLLQLAGGCLAQLSASSAPPSCADQYGEDLRFLGLAKSAQIGEPPAALCSGKAVQQQRSSAGAHN